MRLNEFGREYVIPETMIKGFMIEFKQVKEFSDREALEEIREATSLVLETLRNEPELMEDKEYENDFIKAHAMRQALANYGILYDA